MHRYVCHVITIQNRKWTVCIGNSFHLIKCPKRPEDEGVNNMNHGARQPLRLIGYVTSAYVFNLFVLHFSHL